ncbi:MAG: universal stress protein [Rhodocyclaceae bacterium]|nr:universal stress protein [Rhodocyclaceae bacterium]
MAEVQFIELNAATVFLLVLIGFIGGMVSGFIGSGGAFVLTPAMMSLGAPAMVAVASNICHKFPKALVGAVKRHKYGQVDVKLGVILGMVAEAGMLAGKHVMTSIKQGFGDAGTDLYVSVVFIVVLAIVGGYVLRDYRRLKRLDHALPEAKPGLARWIQSVEIPGTMIHFKAIGARISLLFILPIGFATGMLAATIAVGGFIGVPAMIYLLGVPAIMASATELVIAFVMGLGGTIFYGLEGAVDIRLSMLILLGSLFGIQLGAIGTTYVKDYQVKLVMAVIMLTVLFSRFFYIPGYLSALGMIAPLDHESVGTLKTLGDSVLAVALILGAVTVLTSLTRGMAEHRKEEQRLELEASMARLAPIAATLEPSARLARLVVASDGSQYSSGALTTADDLARATGAEVLVLSVAVVNPEYATAVPELRATALANAETAASLGLAALSAVRRNRLIVEADDPYRGIVEAAEEARADLIVIGRRGKRGLARDLIGDATAKVIGHASCPVLVCPRGAHLAEGPILAATDGSRFGDAATWYAAKLAERLGRRLVVVSAVLPSQTEARRREAVATIERVETALRGGPVAVKGVVDTGRPEQVIVDQARHENAALIVIGTHGRTGLDRLLMGSVAERVIGFADRPVLAVR